MKIHRLERTQVIQRPRAEVFAFFERAENLGRITPRFLNFQIVTEEPIQMRAGTLIDYRIRLFGVPMNWHTEIEEYRAGEHFIDRQLRGPYRLWRHTHSFEDVPGGTRMKDVVEYALGFGPFGSLAHAAFVRSTLKTIFDYRARTIAEIFSAPGA